MIFQEGPSDAMVKDSVVITETTANCIWGDLMDDSEKSTLINGLILTGLLSAVFISWLNYQKPKLILGKLQNTHSYNNLFIFITAVQLRTIVVLLSRFDFIQRIVETWFVRCDFLAFLETFFAVFEVETLTHMCIERYVVAKYITKGWKIMNEHYFIYFYLCIIFAIFYSAPPMYGLGRYGYDFGCISCTYDMLLPDTWLRYWTILIFFLRSFKPAAFMVIMLFWAWRLECNFDVVMKKRADLHFTKCVADLTLINLICWTPIALIRTWVVLSQVINDEIYIPSSFGIRWAMWIHEITPVLTTITVLLYRRCPQIHVRICTKVDSNISAVKED